MCVCVRIRFEYMKVKATFFTYFVKWYAGIKETHASLLHGAHCTEAIRKCWGWARFVLVSLRIVLSLLHFTRHSVACLRHFLFVAVHLLKSGKKWSKEKNEMCIVFVVLHAKCVQAMPWFLLNAILFVTHPECNRLWQYIIYGGVDKDKSAKKKRLYVGCRYGIVYSNTKQHFFYDFFFKATTAMLSQVLYISLLPQLFRFC